MGYNRLIPAEGEVILECQGDPFLTVRRVGQGRTAAFASDCSPHWAPMEFVNWAYYRAFWNQLAQCFNGCVGDVNLVGRTQRLAHKVLDTRHANNRTNHTAGNNTGTRRSPP